MSSPSFGPLSSLPISAIPESESSSSSSSVESSSVSSSSSSSSSSHSSSSSSSSYSSSSSSHTSFSFSEWEAVPDEPQKDDCCGCDTCCSGGPDQADPESVKPIRYATGELKLIVSDVASSGFGASWGHTRSYRNQMSEDIDYGNGFNWLVQEWPYLVLSGTELTVVRAGTASEWFDLIGGVWVGRYGIRETLVDAGAYFTLQSAGGITENYVSPTEASASRGRLDSRISPGNEAIQCFYDIDDGRLLETQRSASLVIERFLYAYDGTSIASVTLERMPEATWLPVRRAVYDYYGASDANGNEGDLKTVVSEVPAVGSGSSTSSVEWLAVGTSYYRYYKDGAGGIGFQHGLKFSLGPEAFQRLSSATGGNPLTAANSVVAQFADYYFEYGTDDRVTKEVTEGGAYEYGFAYADNPTYSPGPANWQRVTTETLPDGSQNIVYVNDVGQVLLKETRNAAATERWIEYQQFNADYNLTLRAEPSAIDMSGTPYDPGENDLDVQLNASSGLIRTYGYYNGTDGPAKYVSYEAIRQGSAGTELKQRTIVYNTSGPVVKIAEETVYRDEVPLSSSSEAGGPITTSYLYSFSYNLAIAKHVILPAVPEDQNGSGVSAERHELFDDFGNLIWEQGPRGFVSKYTYDIATGAMIQRIDDVDGAVETLPFDPIMGTDWTVPSGTRLNVVTDYEVDDQGRVTQELGPVHAAVVGGSATTVRTARWNVYLDDEHETRSAQGYAVLSSESEPISGYDYTLVNPVQITKSDDQWRPIDQISAVRSSIAGRLEPSDSFPQSSWVRWTRQSYDDAGHLTISRVYHTIPSSGSGSEGTNYDETQYGFDSRGRQNRVRGPGGTITRTVYDILSRVIETWIGTDDAGATDDDPSGGGATGNNMVLVSENQYDDGQDGGDSNLTQVTQHVDGSTVRVTDYGYDWRDRQTVVDGEEDFYQTTAYDNLNRSVRVDRYDTVDTGDLVARSETFYDDRGRTYRTLRYSVEGGVPGNALEDNFWFDEAENQIKSLPSGSQTFTKRTYDGLRRQTANYVGYYEPSSSSSSSGAGGEPYAEVGVVTADNKIFAQSFVAYDDASNVLQTSKYQRWHDATGNGELDLPTGSQPKARVSYAAQWYDGAGRQIASANYGTNGDSAFTRPDSVPSRSDDVLVTTIGYDDAGHAFQTIDPADKETRREYDAADQVVRTIDNYDESSSAGDDANLTVETTYTPDGQTATLTAVNAATGDQVTRYLYGTTLDDSEIARSDLLRKVIYPDSDDPSASSDGSDNEFDRVEYRYNRQGQQIEFQDQNETVHAYDYDGLGRRTADRVTLASGSAVDDAVLRIENAYEVRGMLEKVTSYDAASGGSVVNEVLRTYNGFGQLESEYQAHAGAVNVMTTPKVQYAYADGAANNARPTGLTYPNGRELLYDYGAADSDDDRLSRVAAIQGDTGSAAETYVAYTYLGLNAFVRADYTEPQVRWDLITGSSPNPYAGLDRFGRVIDCLWRDYGSSADAERVKYGYDRASNRLWRENTVASGGNDELYAYDGAQRLQDLQRGDLNGGHTAITNLDFAQEWTLDPTGNWSNFKQDDDGNATWDLNQNRTANPVNEITGISGGGWVVPVYDRAGNMTAMPQPNAPTAGYDATYDAWNRLVKLEDGTTVVATYAYDGITRRVTVDDGAAVRHAYFSEQWQVLEERLDSSADAERQFIWGLRYVDDLVLRDRSASSSLDERFYALQDANWNVTAIVNDAGDVQERYRYAAYGAPTFLQPNFSPRSPNQSDFLWEILYAGYRFDADSGLYCVRFRWLHALIGGWIGRDPTHYFDGPNLYDYVHDSPTKYTDPNGTTKVAGSGDCQAVVNYGEDAHSRAHVEIFADGKHVRVDRSGNPIPDQKDQVLGPKGRKLVRDNLAKIKKACDKMEDYRAERKKAALLAKKAKELGGDAGKVLGLIAALSTLLSAAEAIADHDKCSGYLDDLGVKTNGFVNEQNQGRCFDYFISLRNYLVCEGADEQATAIMTMVQIRNVCTFLPS